MKFWPIFQRKAQPEQQRIFEWLDNGGTGRAVVSANEALGVAAVFAARRVIAEDVAKLPARLKRRDGQGGAVADGEPENTILASIGKPANDVDDGFTAMEWIEAIVADAALEGRGVVHLNRVGERVREVTPVPRGRWRCERNRWAIAWEPGKWSPVERGELMVLRGPQLGLSVTRWASNVIALAIQIDRLMLSLAKKGGRPNGIISTDSLSPEQAETLVARIKRWFGSTGDGGLMPMDLANLKFHRISLTPEELKLDDARRSIVEQIASAFRVQPARLMHQMGEQNQASAYQWNIAHVSDTIQPWVRRFCQAFDKDVLGPARARTLYCDVELKGLLSGAPKDRGDFMLKLRTMGALSPAGVARLEDLPIEGLSDDPAFPLLTNPNPGKTEETGNA